MVDMILRPICLRINNSRTKTDLRKFNYFLKIADSKCTLFKALVLVGYLFFRK